MYGGGRFKNGPHMDWAFISKGIVMLANGDNEVK